jgi:hypothetical protein
MAHARERSGAIKGLRNATEHLLAQSTQVVPYEEGILSATGKVSVETRLGAESAAVSYDTVYALRQHEEVTWRHDPGRKAKYLQDSYNENRRAMERLIAAGIRRALRG